MGVGCPMFVPLVENSYTADSCEVTRIISDEYISKLKGFSPDCIILGCTHYPIIRNIIADSAKRILGDNIEIVDSGAEAAYEIKGFLESNNLTSDAGVGNVEYFVSDETVGFAQAASLFLGESISGVTKIDISDYHYTGNK